MRFGVMTLQAAPYPALAERWRRIETMGFDSIWIADHSTSQYPTLIAYEAWTLLGALAAVTKRVRFGPLVTPPTFRHPAVLAMQAVTWITCRVGALSSASAPAALRPTQAS